MGINVFFMRGVDVDGNALHVQVENVTKTIVVARALSYKSQ